MWRILLEGLKKGVATRPYPEDEAPERLRGQVTFDAGRCDRGAACVEACPTRAITLEDDLEHGLTRWEIDHARCLFCGLCEAACARGAIALGSEYRLAVRAKEDLRVATTFPTPGRPGAGL